MLKGQNVLFEIHGIIKNRFKSKGGHSRLFRGVAHCHKILQKA